MTERSVVWIPLGPKAMPHPGVVLRVLDTVHVVAIGGSSKVRDLPHVVVRARTKEAKALDLVADTYFYLITGSVYGGRRARNRTA